MSKSILKPTKDVKIISSHNYPDGGVHFSVTPTPELEVSETKEEGASGNGKGDVVVDPEQHDDTVSKQNGCTRCFIRFLRFIYFHGSIIGPAPCSFLFLCSCSSCCSGNLLGPLKKSSFSTKLMYIIFLGFVTLFSTFFIIAYPESSSHRGVAGLLPCVQSNGNFYQIQGFYGDCRGHAGYFIVYRIFLAMNLMFLTLAFLTIGVTSTKDGCRSGLHQGFWLFKFLLFFVLTLITLLLITLNFNALFDETMMIIALCCTAIFSIPQLVLFLDLIDVFVFKLRTVKTIQRWSRYVYWGTTFFLYMIEFGVLIYLWMYYTKRITNGAGDPMRYGFDDTCQTNKYIISYCFVVGIIITAAMVYTTFSSNTIYPNLGLMQSGVIFGLILSYVSGALGNSVDLECRVVSYPFEHNANSQDVTFTWEGFIHAIFVWVTIIYFALGNGPVSKTAPWSQAVRLICCEKWNGDDHLNKVEIKLTQSQLNVPEEKKIFQLLKDEDKQLQYSWPQFHFFLILGSFSLMMGMTNFIHPRADGPNAASHPAYVCKLTISAIITLGFLIPVIISWVQYWNDQCSRRPQRGKEVILTSALDIEDGVSVFFKKAFSDSSLNGPPTSSIIVQNVASIKSADMAERGESLKLFGNRPNSARNASSLAQMHRTSRVSLK